VGGNSAGATGQALIVRWNGSSWQKVASASPSSNGNVLSGVAATSAASAWAVGSYFTPGGLSQTLIERWNGTTWAQTPSPNPGGATRNNQLAGVAATSASNAWAVGSYAASASDPGHTLIVRWNGTRWAQVPSPNPGGAGHPDSLSGVAATSASDAWAVGSYASSGSAGRNLVVHWDGKTWTQVPSPNAGSAGAANSLSAVAATSASDAWAVGSYSAGGEIRTLTLHWDGKTWTKVPSPNAGTGKNVLYGVAATSATNAWAVGFRFSGPLPNRIILEHWNGKTWAMTASPNPGSATNVLYGVAATSASNAWAVGDYAGATTADRTLTERWNGKTWGKVASPNPGSNGNGLFGVAATSASNAWAVGSS